MNVFSDTMLFTIKHNMDFLYTRFHVFLDNQ